MSADRVPSGTPPTQPAAESNEFFVGLVEEFALPFFYGKPMMFLADARAQAASLARGLYDELTEQGLLRTVEEELDATLAKINAERVARGEAPGGYIAGWYPDELAEFIEEHCNDPFVEGQFAACIDALRELEALRSPDPVRPPEPDGVACNIQPMADPYARVAFPQNDVLSPYVQSGGWFTLGDLKMRLERSAAELLNMLPDDARSHEYTRLVGKRQGVQLALSYLNETIELGGQSEPAVLSPSEASSGQGEPTGPCMSRGPRVGDEGCPYCKLPKGHEGRTHRPAESDGWPAGMTWTDPARSGGLSDTQNPAGRQELLERAADTINRHPLRTAEECYELAETLAAMFGAGGEP